ncbi:MAG: sugar phosphate isomerase/epimerase [Sphaerochaetaceae bacterium]|nr:sugar phosphate isomerase/epimerase [Sphaerochaetaceae bacterium]MDC7249651.1 sugar phosphate isomerase/epimerase [Sphaerochaetaceae bacterium]
MLSIGVVICANEISVPVLDLLKKEGCSTLSISFWKRLDEKKLFEIAKMLESYDFEVTAISIFGNTIESDEIKLAWKKLIKNNKIFGTPFITGFAGRVENHSVEDSIIPWKETFSDFIDLSYKYDCKGLLLENCRMGDTWKRGKWNIAINPSAWNMMFNEINDDKLGLEWEPYHQILAFVDPLDQLENWISKIKHVHGKDAKTNWNKLRKIGLYDKEKAICDALPSFGDTNWQDIINILNKHKFNGSIDIETQNTTFISKKDQILESLHYLNNLI